MLLNIGIIFIEIAFIGIVFFGIVLCFILFFSAIRVENLVPDMSGMSSQCFALLNKLCFSTKDCLLNFIRRGEGAKVPYLTNALTQRASPRHSAVAGNETWGSRLGAGGASHCTPPTRGQREIHCMCVHMRV